MNPVYRAIVLAGLMVAASVGGIAARPAAKQTVAAPKFLLEEMVPRQFGGWHELPRQSVQVVNPQTKVLLDKLYSQLLTRTYADESGYRIMLSIAYGDDQRGDLQAHKPEVCYPAQGFTLHGNVQAQLETPFGEIAVRRLQTSLGQRVEPVTYWFTVGETAIMNKLQHRMVEIRLGLMGQIPDGLLVRISSIDENPGRAAQAHDAFAAALLGAVSVKDRIRLSGLAAVSLP